MRIGMVVFQCIPYDSIRRSSASVRSKGDPLPTNAGSSLGGAPALGVCAGFRGLRALRRRLALPHVMALRRPTTPWAEIE